MKQDNDNIRKIAKECGIADHISDKECDSLHEMIKHMDDPKEYEDQIVLYFNN